MAAMEKNNKTLNVPHLRFPEFDGEWEIHRLGELVEIKSGVSPTGIIDENGLFPFYKVEQLNNCYVELNETPYLTMQSSVPVHSIIFPKRGAAIMTNKIRIASKPCQLDTNLMALIIENNEKVDYKFLFYFIARYNLSKIADTSTIPQINNIHINPLKITLPSIKEQQKISALLTVLDLKIDTQRKIIEDLKKLKDAICNLNFTSGSSLTLGDIGYFVRGLTYSASDVIDDTAGTAVMRSNNISNGDPVNFDELIWVNKTPNHDQILRAGDMVICMANGSSALVGKSSYYINSEIELATVGAFCGIYRSDNPLTKWLFQSTHYKKHLQRSIQGGNGAIANIYPEDILAISFNIPADHERILNILNSLEEKYLLEYKLLCGYLGVKSHLLSQLFI